MSYADVLARGSEGHSLDSRVRGNDEARQAITLRRFCGTWATHRLGSRKTRPLADTRGSERCRSILSRFGSGHRLLTGAARKDVDSRVRGNDE